MSQRSGAGCRSDMIFRAALLALCFVSCGVADQVQASAAPIVVSSAPAECPPTWQEARAWCGAAEAGGCVLGTRCSYPGVGDQLPDGRWADGLLICFDQTGGTGDAGVGEWACAQ